MTTLEILYNGPGFFYVRWNMGSFKRKRPQPANPDLIDIARSHLGIGADPHAVLDLLMDATIRLTDKLPDTGRKSHAISDHVGAMMDRLNGVETQIVVSGEVSAGVLVRHPTPKLKP